MSNSYGVDCGITINYLVEKTKMCRDLGCEFCPLDIENNDEEMSCGDLQEIMPEKAMAIVQKWANENDEDCGTEDDYILW